MSAKVQLFCVSTKSNRSQLFAFVRICEKKLSFTAYHIFTERKLRSKAERETEKQRQFDQRQAKKKEKHREH